MEAEVRKVLQEHGRLSVDAQTVDREADLFGAGLTSHATVNVMLALEDVADVEFPDNLLKKSTFASVAALTEVLEQLCSQAA